MCQMINGLRVKMRLSCNTTYLSCTFVSTCYIVIYVCWLSLWYFWQLFMYSDVIYCLVDFGYFSLSFIFSYHFPSNSHIMWLEFLNTYFFHMCNKNTKKVLKEIYFRIDSTCFLDLLLSNILILWTQEKKHIKRWEK